MTRKTPIVIIHLTLLKGRAIIFFKTYVSSSDISYLNAGGGDNALRNIRLLLYPKIQTLTNRIGETMKKVFLAVVMLSLLLMSSAIAENVMKVEREFGPSFAGFAQNKFI